MFEAWQGHQSMANSQERWQQDVQYNNCQQVDHMGFRDGVPWIQNQTNETF